MSNTFNKVNSQKYVAFLDTNKKHAKKEIKETSLSLTPQRNSIFRNKLN